MFYQTGRKRRSRDHLRCNLEPLSTQHNLKWSTYRFGVIIISPGSELPLRKFLDCFCPLLFCFFCNPVPQYWELSSVVRCGYAQTAIFCGHYWARLHTAPLKDYTVVAVDRLTNAVAMSSAGFSSRSGAIQVGYRQEISLLRERSSMKCLYFTLINSSRIVEIAVSDFRWSVHYYVDRWRHTFIGFHYERRLNLKQDGAK